MHSLHLFYPLFTAKRIFLEQRWQFASEVKGVAYGARQEWGSGGRGRGEVVGVELGRALCRRDDRAVGILAGVVGVYAARRSDNDRRQPAGSARDEVRQSGITAERSDSASLELIVQGELDSAGAGCGDWGGEVGGGLQV